MGKEKNKNIKEDHLRNIILDLFQNKPNLSIKFNVLFAMLQLKKMHKAHVRNILRVLVNEKQLSKFGKYFEHYKAEKLYEGFIAIDKDREYCADVFTESGTERVIIKKKNLLTALEKDRVELSIIEFQDKEYKEGIVEKITQRANHTVAGILEYSKGKDKFAFVIPDDRKFRKDIYIPRNNLKNAENGDKVICEITNWEYQDLSPEGKVIKILGKAGEVKTEFKALINKFNLTKSFSKQIKDELENIALDIEKYFSNKEISKREDIRDKNVFTIDPTDAKDFDDAVSIEINKAGNYLLGVHIADVSHFVKENSELDKEALSRGTSVYLMNDVIPMLPEKLSNDLCSLVEGKDRLTYSVFMEIDKSGEMINSRITKSIIKSKKRFTYEQVQNILDFKTEKISGKGRKKPSIIKESEKINIVNDIMLMYELHKILYKKRLEEGSLDFEKPEVNIIIEDGVIKDIKPKMRLESMRLIEDFMLSANKCVTQFVEKKKPKPEFVYRIHDVPDKKKIRELSIFVKQFGLALNTESKKSLQKMLLSVQGRPEEYLINDIAIRSMAKAEYSTINIGHYGLGFKNYTHFTSPIRRYPDLIVHRMLNEISENLYQKKSEHYKKLLPEICRHSTDREINSVQAEREALKILQIKFLEKHLGDIYTGLISGITEYGIYVELTESLIEGMVRLKNLHDDYYILDEKNYQLTGRYRKKKYRIGDKVKVKVSSIEKNKKWIDFEII